MEKFNIFLITIIAIIIFFNKLLIDWSPVLFLFFLNFILRRYSLNIMEPKSLFFLFKWK